MERIHLLYKGLTGFEPERIEPLSAAGSNRQYFRVWKGEKTVIAVIGTSREENHAFITLSRAFVEAHLPVPRVLAVSEDEMVYLQDDLGNQSLYAAMAEGRANGGQYSEAEKLLLRKTIRVLPQFQFAPVVHPSLKGIFSHCYPQQEMDRTSIMFDLNYFKYCFLKLRGIEFNEYKLQHDFEALADALLKETDSDGSGGGCPNSSSTFLYRDFQSRNVMLKDGEPYFIDFQGGRRGPIYYDVASFLWQSSAKFSDELRNLLIDEYLEALQPYRPLDKPTFMQQLHLFVLFRVLQVLGAYGYRGLWEKKQYFIDSIPQALRNLSAELEHGSCDAYPYLKEVCGALVAQGHQEQQKHPKKVAAFLENDTSYLAANPTEPLTVTVYSFSFKRGIPADESGNGGGYVFDCRSTHNPGRYAEFKPLTGLDQPVIDFLEEDGEILTFLESVYRLVDFHVNRFMQRGFTHLQISFGCTGGHHRSVYSAQHVAEHIHQKFGVKVYVIHREQNMTQVLE